MRADGGALLIGGLRYGDLAVTDVAGRTLPAHLDATEGGIRIAVDARGARWPVTVDPTLAQATLVPSDTTDPPYEDFGNAVAVATAGGVTTVVVGAPGKFINGMAHSARRASSPSRGGSYTQLARLGASDGAAQNGFSSSVAVATDGATTTVVVGGGCVLGYTGGTGKDPNKVYV